MLNLIKFMVGLLFSVQLFAQDITLTANNTISFNNYFEERTVAQAIEKIRKLDSALPSNDPIYLVINSGGGSIVDGLELINVLQNMKRKVHTITLFSASMGFQTVQGLGDRYIVDSGVLMSHKARGGFYGEFPGQVDSRYRYWLNRIQRLDSIAAKRSNMNVKQYQALIENEYWCEGQACVNRGFADKVVKVQCDSTLNGTYDDTDKFIYDGAPIELVYRFSNCPLQTGVLDWNVFIGGQPFFQRITERKPNAYGYTDNSVDFLLSRESLVKLQEVIVTKLEERTSKASKFVVKSESNRSEPPMRNRK